MTASVHGQPVPNYFARASERELHLWADEVTRQADAIEQQGCRGEEALAYVKNLRAFAQLCRDEIDERQLRALGER